jgi:hypothetical protein
MRNNSSSKAANMKSFYRFLRLSLPQFLTGTAEEQVELLQKGVRTECVARITVARARFPEFVKAMQNVLNLGKDNDGTDEASK